MDPERAELRNRVSRYNQSCGPANSHATFPYTNQEYEYKNDGRYSEIQRRRLLSSVCPQEIGVAEILRPYRQ